MKIAVARRGDCWLAQVVYVGDGLHWTEHRLLQSEMIDWIEKNCQGENLIDGWQFYFWDERDLTIFLLRWNS